MCTRSPVDKVLAVVGDRRCSKLPAHTRPASSSGGPSSGRHRETTCLRGHASLQPHEHSHVVPGDLERIASRSIEGKAASGRQHASARVIASTASFSHAAHPHSRHRITTPEEAQFA
nr:hypothetical protein CFP56_77888 [Quercus suber]